MISIGLVQPEVPENLGAVARVMANFGLSDLRILDPRFDILCDDVKRTAKHAQAILERARVFSSFSAMREGFDLVVGTTGRRVPRPKAHRTPITPRELKEVLADKTLILFGRESVGLTNDELKACDITVTIPTSREYPVLNLSHAVAIIAYELYQAKPRRKVDVSGAVTLFERMAEKTGFRKKQEAVNAFRRVLTTASQSQVNMISGVLSECLKKMRD